MEYLPNHLTLDIPEGCFPLSTDSVVLAHFARLPKKATVLDLGAGCGTLGLLLCARDTGCHVTGIELDPAAHSAALENIQRNCLQSRMNSICTDLRQLNQQFPAGSFSVCISNPPYFSSGFASRVTPMARQTDHCSTEDLFRSAGHALKYGGDFFLVHKPENLAHLITCGAARGMEAKRLLLLHHTPNRPVNLIALQFRKGGKPGLQIEEACLFHSDGTPTAYYNEIYHVSGESTGDDTI